MDKIREDSVIENQSTPVVDLARHDCWEFSKIEESVQNLN